MLQEFRSQKLIWDKAKTTFYEPVQANSGDSNGRKLVVKILNNGVEEDLTGSTLSLSWQTRKGDFDGLDVFTPIDITKGEFEIYYTTGMLSNFGKLSASLVLTDAGGVIESLPFVITVHKSNVDSEAVQSDNSFTALTQALVDVNNLEATYAPRLTNVESHLADITYYVTPEMFTGVSDADKINKALNSTSNTVILKSNYTIDETIFIPTGKTLELGTSNLKLISNTDMIHLNNDSRLIGGFVSLDPTVEAVFDKSIIKLLSTNGASTFQTVRDIQVINNSKTGSAISFDVGASGMYIAYANLDNFRIRGFNIGVDITVPNIAPHVAGSGYDNWITTCKIHGFISRANQGLRLNDESNNGSSIQGMDIFLRGQAGDKNVNFDEAIFAKCCQSTFNVILDDAGDTTTVSNYIVFDKLSSRNNYIGANEKVVDNGLENIILNALHYGAPSTIMNVKGSGAKALGYINNILYNADERFEVTADLANCTLSPAMNVFKALGYTTTITKTDINLESIAKYNIVFPSTKSIPTFAVQLTQNYAKCKLRFRYNTTWVESKEFNSSLILVNIYDLFKSHANVNEVEIIFTLPSNYKGSVGIQAITGYGEDAARGNFMPRDGGEAFGNIEYTKSWYGPVLKGPNGTKYRIKVSDDGTLSTQVV